MHNLNGKEASQSSVDFTHMKFLGNVSWKGEHLFRGVVSLCNSIDFILKQHPKTNRTNRIKLSNFLDHFKDIIRQDSY